MGRDKRLGCEAVQQFENQTNERLRFGWIGAGAELIDNHQLIGSDSFEHVSNADQLGAEPSLFLVYRRFLVS